MVVLRQSELSLKNFVKADITSDFNAGTTSFTVTTGQGARFPTVPFALVLTEISRFSDPSDAFEQGAAEIVICTARSTDTLTVIRGVFGTTAFAATGGRKYRFLLDASTGHLDNVPRYLNVKTYGAKGDGTTNDTQAVMDAVADIPAEGAVVFFPRGTYILTQSKTGSDKIIITKSHVTLLGEAGSILKGASGADANSKLIRIEGEVGAPITDIRVKNLSVDGNRAGATVGSGTQSHLFNIMNCERVWIENCYLKESPGDHIRTDYESTTQPVRDLFILHNRMDTCLRNCISIVLAERVVIEGNVMSGYNTFGVDCEPDNSGNTCREIVIANNYVGPPAPTHLNPFNSNRAAGISCKGVAPSDQIDQSSGGTPTYAQNNCRIVGNFVIGVLDSGVQYPAAGIQVEHFRNVSIASNNLYKCRQGIVGGGADSNDTNCSTGTISGNVVRQMTGETSGIGISGRTGWTISGNLVEGCDGPGIRVHGRSCTVIGNLCQDNGSNGSDVSSSRKSGIWLAGEDTTCIGNRCRDTRSTKKQQYGVYLEDGQADNLVSENNLLDNLTGGVRVPASLSGTRIRFNQGYVTENAAESSISSGTTSVVVTHGIDRTPSPIDITITQRGAATADPGDIWVSTITSTQFTVNCRNNPGASGFLFAWSVRARH